jgi:hypothetical protein
MCRGDPGWDATSIGLCIAQLTQRLNPSRTEAIARSHQLQSHGLLEVLQLADVNVRLSRNLQLHFIQPRNVTRNSSVPVAASSPFPILLPGACTLMLGNFQ